MKARVTAVIIHEHVLMTVGHQFGILNLSLDSLGFTLFDFSFSFHHLVC